MRISLSKFTVVSFAVATAAALSACGPSIDPAAKADIDRRSSLLSPGAQAYPAPGAFMPRPLAVGQWVQYRMVDDKNQPSFLTHKVVGAEGNAFWIEGVTESYTGKQVTKILAFLGDRTNLSAVEIWGVKTRDHKGHVQEFDKSMLSIMQGLWKGAIEGLIVSWQGQPQEDATVPAGRFTSCFKARSDVAWGPWHSASTGWSHAAVPISGLVKSQGIDKPMTMDLVGFGDTGAVSELP